MSPANGLFALDPCAAYPLPENRLLVRNPRHGRQAILTPDVYHALLDCREFRSLDAHAAHLAATNPALANQQQHIRQVLEKVRGDGLLVSAEVYGQLLAPSGRQVALTDAPVLAVITWERPEALARCLDSMARHCALEACSRLYVIDDSRSPEVMAKNRASTAALASRAALPVHYMGAGEQADFMSRIIAQAPTLEEPLRFLVDRQRWSTHWTSGLARTVALLLSVGERLLVLDDDILCEVFEPYRQAGGVSFGDAVREAAFFRDNAEWQGFRATTGTDPLARHSRVLGLGLADALSALQLTSLDEGSFAGATVAFLEQLDGEAPVLVTECGSLGDPGTVVTNWLTSLDGESRARLLADEGTVRNALQTRNYWHGRSRPHIAMRSNMSQLTGLDNRRLLPPYIPVMRGEDGLFGCMLEFMHPRRVVLDQAWAVPHLPIPARRWSEVDSAFNTDTTFPTFILGMLIERPPQSDFQDPVRRLGRVAGQFEELSELDHRRVMARFIDQRLESRASRYVHLKKLRAECAGAPQPWLDYLDQAISALNLLLADNPVEAELRGYPSQLSGPRLSDWWQDFWKRFGHSLRAWPALRQAARHCREMPSSH